MGDFAGADSLAVVLLGLPQLYVSLVGLATPATYTQKAHINIAFDLLSSPLTRMPGFPGPQHVPEDMLLQQWCCSCGPQ